MRFPRMTTRLWMLLVAALAVWMGMMVRGHRFRRLSEAHMARSAQVRVEAAVARHGGPMRTTPLSAWHQDRALTYRMKAENVEALCVTMVLVALTLAIAAPLVRARKRRRGALSAPANGGAEGPVR